VRNAFPLPSPMWFWRGFSRYTTSMRESDTATHIYTHSRFTSDTRAGHGIRTGLSQSTVFIAEGESSVRTATPRTLDTVSSQG
jgi:hypothetical protein